MEKLIVKNEETVKWDSKKHSSVKEISVFSGGLLYIGNDIEVDSIKIDNQGEVIINSPSIKIYSSLISNSGEIFVLCNDVIIASKVIENYNSIKGNDSTLIVGCESVSSYLELICCSIVSNGSIHLENHLTAKSIYITDPKKINTSSNIWENDQLRICITDKNNDDIYNPKIINITRLSRIDRQSQD